MDFAGKCKKCNNTGRVKIDCGYVDEGLKHFEDGYCDCIIGEELLREEVCLDCGEMKEHCICNCIDNINRGIEDVKEGRVKKLKVKDL